MKKIIFTENAPAAVGPYSQAVEVNGMLFISGQIPINPATGSVEAADIISQTKQVLINLKAVANAAGYDLGDAVKTTCLLSDMANFKAMNMVYADFFPVDPPARAAFAVKELPLSVLIEIEAVLVK